MVRTIIGRVGRPKETATPLVFGALSPDGSTTSGAGGPSLSPLMTFTRSSDGTYVDPYGITQTAGTNVRRITNSQYVGTNYVPNPWALSTTLGTPGVSASDYSIIINGGLTRTIIGTGVEDGIPYIDFRVQGRIASASQHGVFSMPTTSSALAKQGDTFTSSFYARLLSGSNNGILILYNILQELDSTRVNLVLHAPVEDVPTNAPLRTQRYVVTRTLTNVGTAYARSQLLINTTADTDIDFTWRVGGFQFEQTSAVTPLMLPPVGTRGPTTRHTGNRLLMESGRTNSYTNILGAGVRTASGLGGATNLTDDANWKVINHTNTMTLSVEPATYMGMTGMRLSYIGTSVAGAENQEFAPRNVIATAGSATWTGSFYIRQVSGASGVEIGGRFIGQDAGAVVTDNVTGPRVPLTQKLTRISQTLTVGASTAFITHGPAWGIPIGTTDFVVEIFYPQLELGVFASSMILPAGGGSGPVTRSGDLLSPAMGQWYQYRGPIKNYIPNSENFAIPTPWFAANLGVTLNAAAGPDNIGTNADKLVPDATTDFHVLVQNTPERPPNGVPLTISIYAKYVDMEMLWLQVDGSGASTRFSLIEAAVKTNNQANIAQGVEPGVNGWNRYWMTFMMNPSMNGLTYKTYVSSTSNATTPGDGVAGVLVWGAMISHGIGTVPYVATDTTSVTAYRAGPGTFVWKGVLNPNIPGTIHSLFAMDGGGASNRFYVHVNGEVTSIRVRAFAGSTSTQLVDIGSFTPYAPVTVVVSYDETGIIGAINGGTPVTAAGYIPLWMFDRVYLGNSGIGASSGRLFGEVGSFNHYPYKMTAAQVQAASA